MSDEFQPIETCTAPPYEHVMVRVFGRNRVEGYKNDEGQWTVNGKVMDPQPNEWQPLWNGSGYDPDPLNVEKHDPTHKPSVPVDRRRTP